jgi:peptidoglycan/LPS O-acetylase OafA/YrhL
MKSVGFINLKLIFTLIMNSNAHLSKVEPSYFPALTGIRAISAFFVYVHHFHPFSEDLIVSRLFRILRETHIGVSFFSFYRAF